jgi:hypothetical protein
MPLNDEAAVVVGKKPRIRIKLWAPKTAINKLNKMLIDRDTLMDIANFENKNGLLCGAPFDTEAKSLKDVRVGLVMNFVPLRADPCISKKLLMKLFGIFRNDAHNFISQNIWFERCPFVLPYDADCGENKPRYERILGETDFPIKTCH